MENRSHALAAGSFVLVLFTLLVALWLWLTRDQQQYTAYDLSSDDTITGLQVQASVRYKGVPVGRVTSIGFDPGRTGRVLIRLAVDASAPIHPGRTYAQLGYQGITGLAHIQLDDSEQTSAPLPASPDGTARLPMRSSALNLLADQGAALLERVEETTRRINQMLGDANQQRLSRLLESLTHTSEDIAQTTRTLSATLRDRVNPALDAVPPLATQAGHTLHSLSATSEQAAALLHDLNAPGGPVQHLQEGMAGMARAARSLEHRTLPGVNQAVQDVARAAQRLEDAIGALADNPQSLLYGHGNPPPGPGENGFVPPPARTSASETASAP